MNRPVKISSVIFLSLLLNFHVFSQSEINSSGFSPKISISDISWKKYRYRPPTHPSHSIMIGGQPRSRTNDGKPDRINIPSPKFESTTKGFIYSFKIKNNGQNKIEVIEWTYLFSDSRTNKIIEAHRFKSENQEISPGKTRQIREFSIKPPTKIVDAELLKKNAKNTYSESILVNRIIYSDGSIWVSKVHP